LHDPEACSPLLTDTLILFAYCYTSPFVISQMGSLACVLPQQTITQTT
jgi:hypothetical protein